MLAVAATAAVTSTLVVIATPALAATQVEVPVAAGDDVIVVADLGDALVSMRHSTVEQATTAYFSLEEWDSLVFGPAPAGSQPFAAIQAYLYDPAPAGQTVVTCFDFSVAAVPQSDFDVYTFSTVTGELEVYPSYLNGQNETCITEPTASQGQFYMLSTPEVIAPPDADLAITRVFEPLDIGFGEGPQNGVYLDVQITNNEATPITIGLGADLAAEGVDEKLWQGETWGLPGDASFEGVFTATIQPGEISGLQVPDWPGKTYTFWSLDAVTLAPESVLSTYETGGLFSRVRIDIENGVVEVGSAATFAGQTVFAGATTTVEADGLIPGQVYDLWLTPGLDYLSFMILGGLLADEAVQVGAATVDPTGKLATAFSVPTTAAVGDRFQLMIGDPDTRSWPAGTLEQITIAVPDAGGATVSLPTPSELEVSIPLIDTSVLFSFPAGTTAGETTASASTTGPAAVGFSTLSDPPVYLHLSTTATFAGAVEVCVGVPGSGDSAGLGLYHYVLNGSAYQWTDITTRRTATAVCGETESFSPFVLGVPDEPVVDDVILTSKEQCKKGGWATSTAPVFTNQGACVSYFTSGKDKPKGGHHDGGKPKGGHDKPTGGHGHAGKDKCAGKPKGKP